MPRQIALVLLLLLGGCASRDRASIRAVDFIREFDRADQRPPRAYSIGERQYPSIVAPAPGRITWVLPLPRHAQFRARVAVDGSAAVRFRVVVSDGRVSENLFSSVGAPGSSWNDVVVDLSAYAGRKWSLFYRPDSIAWHVTLSTDAAENVPSRGLWGAPEIVTDQAGWREYQRRRLSFTGS